MEPTPRMTVDDAYAQGLNCAICGEGPLRVVHLARYPDYVTCQACNAAFVVEEGGERVMYGHIPERFTETRRLALNQWAWFEAVARWARQEREPPTSPAREPAPPQEAEASIPSPPEEKAAQPQAPEVSPAEAPHAEPEASHEPEPPEPAQAEDPLGEPAVPPESEPAEPPPPLSDWESLAVPGLEAEEEAPPAEEEDAFFARLRGEPEPEVEAAPPRPTAASAGEAAPEVEKATPGEPAEAPAPAAVEPEEAPAEAAPAPPPEAAPQVGAAGEPPPGLRYRVALRPGRVKIPRDACAHCLRSPVRGWLAVVADLPAGQQLAQRRTVIFRVPLCQACQRRATARSEAEKAARLQAHLLSLLIALLLVVGALALGVVTASDPLTLGFLLLVLAALGYTAPVLFLLSRAGRHPPPPEARYVRTTLLIPVEDRGLEIPFEWRNRGYAERFLEANRDLATGGVVEVKDRLALPPAKAEDGPEETPA